MPLVNKYDQVTPSSTYCMVNTKKMYSFDDLGKFMKEQRDERSRIMTELCGKGAWTLDNIKRKENSKETIAEAMIQFANDLNLALKWVQKVHGDHFRTMQDLIAAKNESENKTIEAVGSLKTFIEENTTDLKTAMGDRVDMGFGLAYDCQRHLETQIEKADQVQRHLETQIEKADQAPFGL